MQKPECDASPQFHTNKDIFASQTQTQDGLLLSTERTRSCLSVLTPSAIFAHTSGLLEWTDVYTESWHSHLAFYRMLVHWTYAFYYKDNHSELISKAYGLTTGFISHFWASSFGWCLSTANDALVFEDYILALPHNKSKWTFWNISKNCKRWHVIRTTFLIVHQPKLPHVHIFINMTCCFSTQLANVYKGLQLWTKQDWEFWLVGHQKVFLRVDSSAVTSPRVDTTSDACSVLYVPVLFPVSKTFAATKTFKQLFQRL